MAEPQPAQTPPITQGLKPFGDFERLGMYGQCQTTSELVESNRTCPQFDSSPHFEIRIE